MFSLHKVQFKGNLRTTSNNDSPLTINDYNNNDYNVLSTILK